MIKIEIASYPKSGNTWFRRLTENYLKNLDGLELHPMDIHQKLDEVLDNKGAQHLSTIDDMVFVYKSHNHSHSKVQPDRIIHIYRHPLDVFLSSLNFLYNQSSNMKFEIRNNIWKNGEAKSVDDIYKDGEMPYYFNEFLSKVGGNYYPGMLGDKSNYFSYIKSALDCNKTISIKYEELIQDTEYFVNLVMNDVLSINKCIPIDTALVDSKTKNSSNKRFFWKSKAKNYEDYLSEEQINVFEKKYSKELKEIGYIL